MAPRTNKSVDSFERKGGYASGKVPRAQMKPPPSSATRPKNEPAPTGAPPRQTGT